MCASLGTSCSVVYKIKGFGTLLVLVYKSSFLDGQHFESIKGAVLILALPSFGDCLKQRASTSKHYCVG